MTVKEKAMAKVKDHLSSLGFGTWSSGVVADFPFAPGAAHFIILSVDCGKPVPLTVALLAPNGKLYFPITNEVVDLNENDVPNFVKHPPSQDFIRICGERELNQAEQY